ncbi:XdhC family protein [Rhizohabitans arisaemae]|uniref:XdhC family protein n=1 Tax=Rhizohabitans arisaemae TaxID=2720610 RepID=UPI0024B13152|nr:XdhC/CoxI family protein [Rhizohabitans arisaemae]
MKEIAETLLAWRRDGIRFALATVVATWKSAPRQPGAAMAVAESGEVVGSVSGGCVEGALYELALEVIESGEPRLAHYGVSDDEAFGVGLTCGGMLDVLVVPVDDHSYPEFAELAAAVVAGKPIAVATVTGGLPEIGGRLVVTDAGTAGTLGRVRRDAAIAELARGMLASGRTGTVRTGLDGRRREDDLSVFVQSFSPPPRMLVFGAIDFAAAVTRIGKFLGYHVTVCDARPVFATAKRFPDADEVVVDWPHRYLATAHVDERTAICVLTHDPKFDVPLLTLAVRTPARYIGVMGSRRTHEDRNARLRAEGVTEAELARLSSPIGLDLCARTPEETAVAIAAEIIALTWGGTGARLSTITEAIHR